jgi:hypothetical protein
MTAWLTLFGGVAFLGALIALHWSYFQSNFSGDGRLAIRLPLTLGTGAKHLLLRPAAQSGFNLEPFPAVSGVTEAAKQLLSDDCAAPKPESIDTPSAVQSQSKKIPTARSISFAKSVPSLALPLSLLESPAPLAPVTDNNSDDRLIVGDSHLLLDGIVTKTELVCWGDVEIGAGSVIGACMKVRGNMRAGANVTFLGSVVVNGNISTGENCVFLFDVVSKGEIFFGKGTRLGSSTDELVTPIVQRRPADRTDFAAGSLPGSQYEMRYG